MLSGSSAHTNISGLTQSHREGHASLGKCLPVLQMDVNQIAPMETHHLSQSLAETTACMLRMLEHHITNMTRMARFQLFFREFLAWRPIMTPIQRPDKDIPTFPPSGGSKWK